MHMMRTARTLSLMNANMSVARLSRGSTSPELTMSTVIITFIFIIALFIYLIRKMR